jgi:hypothetical protein
MLKKPSLLFIVMIDLFIFSESGPSLRVSSHHSHLPNAVASSNCRILLPDRLTFTSAFRVKSLVRCPCNPGRGKQPRGRHTSPSIELRVRLHRSKVICGIKADPFTFSLTVDIVNILSSSPQLQAPATMIFLRSVFALSFAIVALALPYPISHKLMPGTLYVIVISMPVKKLYQLLINADSVGHITHERGVVHVRPIGLADTKPSVSQLT